MMVFLFLKGVYMNNAEREARRLGNNINLKDPSVMVSDVIMEFSQDSDFLFHCYIGKLIMITNDIEYVSDDLNVYKYCRPVSFKLRPDEIYLNETGIPAYYAPSQSATSTSTKIPITKPTSDYVKWLEKQVDEK
jgi:hypothetical protein